MSQFWNANRSTAEALLDAIDAQSKDSVHKERRTAVRISWRTRLKLIITHPGGNTDTHEVLTRDISATGISFVHVGFLHSGTMCTLQILTRENAWINTQATVVRCRYLGGRLHEIGAKFAQRINISQVVPQELNGTILLVEDVPTMARLTSHHLEKSGLQAIIATTGQDALEKINERSFDLILMDEMLPDTRGHEIVQQLRQQGLTTPVITLTADDDQELRNKCIEAGCNGFLQKPVDKQKLLNAIRRCMVPDEVIYSEFANDKDMRKFIEEFVEELPNRMNTLATLTEKQQISGLKAAAAELKVLASTSGGCGFNAVSLAAERLEEAIREGCDWNAIEELLGELQSLASRVSSSDPE